MIRRAISVGIGTVIATLLLAGCGTATFDNEFEVSVSDAGDRLGTDRVLVALFDPQMGIPEYRAEDKSQIGVTTPEQPYTATLFATATKMVGDSSPPQDVRAGLYLPQLHDDAYYSLNLKPIDGAVIDYQAPYVNFEAGYEPVGQKPKTAPPLPMTITTTQGEKGWQIAIQVDLPTR